MIFQLISVYFRKEPKNGKKEDITDTPKKYYFQTGFVGFNGDYSATRKNRDTDKKINRIIKEIIQIKDNDLKIKETAEQLEEDQFEEDQLKEEIEKEKKRLWDKWVGEDLYFGDIADYMLLPFLIKKFVKLNLHFSEGMRNYYVSDDVNHISISTDFMMRNNEKEMLVKMEKELTIEEVKKHIERLEQMRVYADLKGDKRTFLGALASIVVTDEARNYALNQGFYLIEPSGISFKITPPQGKPKEW